MKELIKSDSICQSYAQMKKGPVFLTHSVHWCLLVVERRWTHRVGYKLRWAAFLQVRKLVLCSTSKCLRSLCFSRPRPAFQPVTNVSLPSPGYAMDFDEIHRWNVYIFGQNCNRHKGAGYEIKFESTSVGCATMSLHRRRRQMPSRTQFDIDFKILLSNFI